jgi:hypothetical protein
MMKLDDLISEAQAYERYGHLFAAGELREARQRGEIEVYALRKGFFYIEQQLTQYLEKRVRRPWQNAPLRAALENESGPGSSNSNHNGSSSNPAAQTIIGAGSETVDALVAKALAQPISKKPKRS